jgi:hypothetical protein
MIEVLRIHALVRAAHEKQHAARVTDRITRACNRRHVQAQQRNPKLAFGPLASVGPNGAGAAR